MRQLDNFSPIDAYENTDSFIELIGDFEVIDLDHSIGNTNKFTVLLSNHGIVNQISFDLLKQTGYDENEVIGSHYSNFLAPKTNYFLRYYQLSSLHGETLTLRMRARNRQFFLFLCKFEMVPILDSEDFGLLISLSVHEGHRFITNQLVNASILGKELERKRVARDIHDSLGQELHAVHMYIKSLQQIDRNSPIFDEVFNELASLVKQTIDSVSSISYDLMPDSLRDKCLIKVIQDFMFKVNRVGVTPVRFFYDSDISLFLPDERKKMVFRIIQEFVQNSIEHAEANQIVIQVSSTMQGIEFNLQDDGKGFEMKNICRSNGLSNIQERLRVLQLKYSFTSQPGVGTQLKFQIHE